MDATPRELVDQPRVDRAERELAALRALLKPLGGVENETDLGPGKVGVDDESRAPAHLVLEPPSAQRLADGGGLARLPDDRGVNGLSAAPIPHERRLALVRDADRGDVLALRARRPERSPRRPQLTLPDLGRIVLHPARFREVLGKLTLFDRRHGARSIEEDRP